MAAVHRVSKSQTELGRLNTHTFPHLEEVVFSFLCILRLMAQRDNIGNE